MSAPDVACPICLEDPVPFGDNKGWVLTECCCHWFHADCLDKLPVDDRKCPLCRATMFVPTYVGADGMLTFSPSPSSAVQLGIAARGAQDVLLMSPSEPEFFRTTYSRGPIAEMWGPLRVSITLPRAEDHHPITFGQGFCAFDWGDKDHSNEEENAIH